MVIRIRTNPKNILTATVKFCCANYTPTQHPASFSTFVKSKWVTTHPEQNPGILSSVHSIDPIFNTTIPEFLRTNLHKFENDPAFECAVTGRSYTHGEIHRKSRSFAASLKQHGLQRGTAVCILLPNIPEYPIATLGIWEAGLMASTINPGYTPEEISSQVNDCGASVIITIPQLLPTLETVKDKSPTLRSVVVVGNDALPPGGGYHSFYDMLNTDPSSTKLLQGNDINSLRETAVLPYSSGTTGPPKGVELTHSTFTTNLTQIMYPEYRLLEFNEGGKNNRQERLIALLPFFHMYGMQIIMANSLYSGSHTLCFPKFEPELFLKGMKHHRPTVLHMVTPLLNFVSQTSSQQLTSEDLRFVRGTIAGGAPIGKTVAERYLDRFDHYTLFQEGFGMTELSSVSHFIHPEMKNSKVGSAGILIPGTTSKLVDTELGSVVVEPGKSGEIYVRGPQVMKGYFNNETATKEAIDTEGYLRTGDIGYYDDEGCLYIVDRLKELIKVKGLQVAPAELENVLRTHPEIGDVAVIGVPHEKWGEAPRAYIVPKKKSPSLDEVAVKGFLQGKVSSHKQLEGGVEFIDAIPKSASGKILRRVLQNMYRST